MTTMLDGRAEVRAKGKALIKQADRLLCENESLGIPLKFKLS